MRKIRFETVYLSVCAILYIVSAIFTIYAICNTDDKSVEQGICGMTLSIFPIFVVWLIEVIGNDI